MRNISLPLLIFSLLSSPVFAQSQSDVERQIAQDRQAASDRREQAARSEATQRDMEAQRQRAKQEATGRKDGIYRIIPVTSSHSWTVGHWKIWAISDDVCFAVNQWDTQKVQFWGFRQKGPQLELFFYSDGTPQPQTLQMSFNDGGKFNYDAKVEHIAEYDAYVISLGKATTAVFPNVIDFEADAGGNRIWWERELNMSKVESAMNKCWEWQLDH